jgi:uncharacterized protein
MNMRTIARTVETLVFVAILILPSFTFAFTSPGNPTDYVNDFAHVLSPDTVKELNTNLRAFEATSTIQIAVATVPSVGGDSIDSYANQLFRTWGIGDAKKNNGILIVVAPKDHAARIEVGYGLEGTLTDLQSGEIVNNIMIPSFKTGDYDTGVSTGVASVEGVLTGDTSMLDQSVANAQSQDGKKASSKTLFNNLKENGELLLLFVSLWVVSVLGRSRWWWTGSIYGLVLGPCLYLLNAPVFSWIDILLASLVCGGIGLFLDYQVSLLYKRAKKLGTSPSALAGGSAFNSFDSSSSSSSSGGFGGFGGGSSGGGGASGTW